MSKPLNCGLLVAAPLLVGKNFSALQRKSHLFPHLEMDWEHLHQLADGCTEFELELLELFVQDSDEQLQKLRQAIAHQDLVDSECAAHHLKGASGNVGVNAMYSIAAQLEQQFRQKQVEGVESLVNQLEDLLRDVQTLLKLAFV